MVQKSFIVPESVGHSACLLVECRKALFSVVSAPAALRLSATWGSSLPPVSNSKNGENNILKVKYAVPTIVLRQAN